MANYFASSDAANTAVRAFLTRVGEQYLGKSFNKGADSLKLGKGEPPAGKAEG